MIFLRGFFNKHTSDQQTLLSMRHVMVDALKNKGAEYRSVADDFAQYEIKLGLPFRLVFGAKSLLVHLASYNATNVRTASLSQMEAPPGSGLYTDLAFQIRPRDTVCAPLLHGEILRPMAGMKGMFSLDLYNFNPHDVDVTDFVENHLEGYVPMFDKVAPFQRTPAQGRGKFTKHLVAFKSKYRIELGEPPAKDPQQLRQYFDVSKQAFEVIINGYLQAVGKVKASDDPEVAARNRAGFDKFFQILLEKDFAVKMGKRLFKQDFQNYFHQGFWGREEAHC